MNVGRLLQGLQRGACQVLRNLHPSFQSPGSNVGLIVRTLMTNRCQSLLQPRNLVTYNTPIISNNPALITTPRAATCPLATAQQTRTKTHYSRTAGKAYSVTAVPARFFRLHNGQWIRTRAGRNKRKWRKSLARLNRLGEHVMVTRRQCQLLDRMVGPIYKKRRHYPDDPYAAYHKWDNLPLYRVLKDKPRFLP